MFVCCECCVLPDRVLCDGLITRPEESYRLWRVVVCDLETSKMRRLKPAMGLWKIQPKGCNGRKTNNKQFLFVRVASNYNFLCMGYKPRARQSPAVRLVPVSSGQACSGMAFPPFLIERLHRCGSVVIASFVD